MRAIIAGASGLLGSALTERLLARGDEAAHLVRRKPNPDSEVDEIFWDPSDPASVEPTDLGHVDAVFNFSGATVAHRWSNSYKRLIYESRVTTTSTLVDVMSRMPTPPQTLITASGLAIYGDRGDEQLTEASEPGGSFLASVAIPWEASTMRAAEFGCRALTVRLGAVLTARGGALETWVKPFRFGLGGKLGNGRQWTPWIHLDDAIDAFIFLADNESLEGPVNVVSPGVVRNSEFSKLIGEALRRPAIFWMPAVVARLVIGEYITELAIHSALAIPEKLLDSGFEFKYRDLRDCLRDELGT